MGENEKGTELPTPEERPVKTNIQKLASAEELPLETIAPEPIHRRQARELFGIFKEDSTFLKILHFIHKEWRAMKDGRWAFMILSALIIFLTYWISGDWIYNPRIEGLNRDLTNSDRAKQEAERDRDKYQLADQNAENALAPWKELAINRFPGEPINKSMNKLGDEVHSFIKLMKDVATKESVERLAAIADAERDYHDMAMLNMIGKPQVDGDIVYTTSISKAMDGSYTLKGVQVAYNVDSVAEQKFKDTIALEPRFPFSYIGLGIILHNRKDASWRDSFLKSQSILEKTVLVPGHHPNHDYCLAKVKEVLNSPESTTPPWSTPDKSTSQP